MNAVIPHGADRLARAGELCTCGRPAVVVYLTERFGGVGYCGQPGVSSSPLSEATVAGVRATIVQAARVIEQVGWTQGQSQSLTGAVCIGMAIAIAADGDEDAELHATNAMQALLPWSSLVEWNDELERTQDEVLDLLRFAAAAAGSAA